jgi:3',5'-cyclic AMP phosphodiesterase CpdA
MIARLQLSDLHLGDPRSTLSNPDVADVVTDALAELSGGEVSKLVLAGDVHEECVPGEVGKVTQGIADSVARASEHFFGSLFEKVRVGELVHVPGNHDLSTWHWYRDQLKLSAVTDYRGEGVDASAWPWRVLYPGLKSKLTGAYPLYWDRSPGDDWPVLLTTHGHLVDPLVLGWDRVTTYAFLEALGCVRPVVPTEASGIGSMRQVAEVTLPFCLHLWRRYSALDYTYSNYVMRRLEHPQTCHFQSSREHWFDAEPGMKFDAPPPGEGYAANLPWLCEVLLLDPALPSPVGSLRQDQRDETFHQRSCLTFGHDHLGTFKDIVACGVPFAVADSGGWTSEFGGHLPHTHVLVWREASEVVPVPYFVRARTKKGGVL